VLVPAGVTTGVMTAKEPGSVAAFFTGLLPDELVGAYIKLLSADRIGKEEAAGFLGGAHIVQELCDRGLAHAIPHTPTAPATFQATPVALAVQAVLADILKQQQNLLAGQRRLIEAQTLPDDTARKLPEHLVQIITDREEILRRSTHLVNTARRDWMTLETAVTDMPRSEDNRISCPKALRDQVRIRSIYERATTRDPVALENIRKCMDAGEEARILPVVPIKLQIADEAAALLALTPTGTGGALQIHATIVIRALRAFFELLWEKASPLYGAKPVPGCPLTAAQQEILGLLALGHADAHIAKKTGHGVSTVRRHITAISELAGHPKSRFALAVAVERRGWLQGSKESNA